MASLPLIYNPFCELEEIIGSVFSPSRLHHNATVLSSSRAFRPKYVHFTYPISKHTQHSLHSLDLHEDAEKNLVTATLELPGIRKEDIQLSVHNSILTISAENKISSEHEESGYTVRERQYGKLSRSLRLFQGVKVSLLPTHYIE